MSVRTIIEDETAKQFLVRHAYAPNTWVPVTQGDAYFIFRHRGSKIRAFEVYKITRDSPWRVGVQVKPAAGQEGSWLTLGSLSRNMLAVTAIDMAMKMASDFYRQNLIESESPKEFLTRKGDARSSWRLDREGSGYVVWVNAFRPREYFFIWRNPIGDWEIMVRGATGSMLYVIRIFPDSKSYAEVTALAKDAAADHYRRISA